jgi:hypothetical protein
MNTAIMEFGTQILRRSSFQSLYAAYRFFKGSAGYVGGKKAIGALQLAKAEREAMYRGFRFVWEDDADGAYMWKKDGEAFEMCEGCICYSMDGEVLASLWGITDADRDYRRVVEAELALEAV